MLRFLPHFVLTKTRVGIQWFGYAFTTDRFAALMLLMVIVIMVIAKIAHQLMGMPFRLW